MKSISKPAFTVPLLAAAVFALIVVSDLSGITDNMDSTLGLLVSTIVLQVAVFVLPGIFYARLKHIKYIKTANVRAFKVSRMLLISAALGVMLTGALLINVAIFAAGGDMSPLEGAGDAVSGMSSAGGLLATVMTVCVIPAVCEEFVFRGIVYGEYSEYGALPAAIFSSLLFAMAHFSISGFASNFFCGFLLAITVIVTRSLIASMVLHASYNLLSVFFVPYIKSVLFEPLGTLFTVFICAGLFLLFTVLMLAEIQAIYREYARRPLVASEQEDKIGGVGFFAGMREIALSIPLAVCALIFIIFTFIIKI